MSRNWEGEDDSDLAVLNQGRFERNLSVAFKSKKGKKYLEDFIASLEAMPVKELIHGKLAQEYVNDWLEISYKACAIGAYALNKGYDPKLLIDEWDDYYGSYETVDIGRNLGMTSVMSWAIGYTNDECHVSSDEERWKFMHWWANEVLRTGKYIDAWYVKWVPQSV